ncbi:MAG: endonuclease [Acidobacteria bacterium]|nr:endonuclease [Acidobacteriota bacterium]
MSRPAPSVTGMTPRLAPVLLLALLTAACSPERTGPGETTPGPTAAPSTSGAATSAPATTGKAPRVEATPLQVLDGDTLLVSLDGSEEEVRLLGVNAPERDECFGDQAREALAGLLGDGPLLVEAQRERDQFGRLLAYAYVGDHLLNLALVEAGLVLALQDDHPRLAEFLRADEQAFASGLGMWAADACGTPSGASITLLEIEANPPGPDEDDLNGEWVLLENEGGQAADLTGWVLRDESSEHRYRFPEGTLLEPGDQAAVYTGCGSDGGGDLYWCKGGPVWSNGGDTALLLDPQGNVADRLRYAG